MFLRSVLFFSLMTFWAVSSLGATSVSRFIVHDYPHKNKVVNSVIYIGSYTDELARKIALNFKRASQFREGSLSGPSCDLSDFNISHIARCYTNSKHVEINELENKEIVIRFSLEGNGNYSMDSNHLVFRGPGTTEISEILNESRAGVNGRDLFEVGSQLSISVPTVNPNPDFTIPRDRFSCTIPGADGLTLKLCSLKINQLKN